MSTKKLGGLDKKIGSKKLNISDKLGGDKAGIALALSGIPGVQQQAMHSEGVIGKRAGDTGMSSVERDEKLASEAQQQAERDKLAATTEAERKRRAQEEATRLAEEEARKKLREAQSGGFAANILSGGGLTFGGSARRRLAGS